MSGINLAPGEVGIPRIVAAIRQLAQGQWFTQAGAGAVTRGWQSKARDIFDIRDFGALCDGSTDDTAAITAADVAAAAANAKLHFPGSFIKVSSLTPSANAHWIGEASQLTTIYTSSASATTFTLSNANVIIENMRVVPAVARNSNAITFNLTAAGRVIVRNVDLVSPGIAFKINGASVMPWIDNCTTSATVLNGVDVQVAACFIGTVSNCTFSGDSGARAFAHFLIENIAGQLQLYNNSAFQASQGIAVIPGNGQSVTLLKCILNYMDNNPNGAFNIVPSGTGTVARCFFVDGWLTSPSGTPVTLTGNGTNIDQVLIRDCEIITSGGTVGVNADGIKRLQLVGNNVLNAANGFTVDDCLQSAVTRNKFVGISGTGLFLTGTSDKIIIDSNDFTGAATPVSNSASGANNKFRHNIGYADTPALTAAEGGTGLTSLGSGVATFLGTPSSANLAAALTDETGTGAAVFAGSPTFTTQITSPKVVGTNGIETSYMFDGSGASVVITAGNTASISHAGLLVLTDATHTGTTAAFLLGGNAVALLGQTGTNFQATDPGAASNKIGVYYSSGYKIRNGYAATTTLAGGGAFRSRATD